MESYEIHVLIYVYNDDTLAITLVVPILFSV